MKRRIIAVLLLLSTIFNLSAIAATSSNKKIDIKPIQGKIIENTTSAIERSKTPFIYNKNIYVDLETIASFVESPIIWDSNKNTITFGYTGDYNLECAMKQLELYYNNCGFIYRPNKDITLSSYKSYYMCFEVIGAYETLPTNKFTVYYHAFNDNLCSYDAKKEQFIPVAGPTG